MSKFLNQETNMKDGTCLKNALKGMGHPVEVHDTPVPLEDYMGSRRKQTAEIVIPRKSISIVSNDIGFKKQTDGTWLAMISEFDSSELGPKWLETVQFEYQREFAKKTALKQGLNFAARTEKEVSLGGRKFLHMRIPVRG